MPDDTSTPPIPGSEPTGPLRWAPIEILRQRATAARGQRDDSIAALRATTDDNQIRVKFGIDLDAVTGADSPLEQPDDGEPTEREVDP